MGEPIQANVVALAEPQPMAPATIIERAIVQGASVDVIERLIALQERYDANQARKAFDAALAAAKAELPIIAKTREVDFTSQKGRTHYRYEDLAGLMRVVDSVLPKHGLGVRFRTTSNPNEPVTVTCILFHRDGHSEENTLSAGRDDTGNKNSIQAVGSTITYLQRYTLKAALGLAASSDDDGAKADGGAITDEQADQIRALILETKADTERFLKYIGAASIPDIPASKFNDALAALERKRRTA